MSETRQEPLSADAQRMHDQNLRDLRERMLRDAAESQSRTSASRYENFGFAVHQTDADSNLAQPPTTGKAREVKITSISHGFIVNIGCSTFAIETIVKLTCLLGEYLQNPEKTELDYLTGKLKL
jgi:hypothetical protein